MGFIITVAIVGLIMWFLYSQNNRLSVTNIELPANVANEVRIVQLSDTHSHLFGQRNEKLYAKVKALKPDVIFHTGDVLDTWSQAAQRYADTLPGLTAIAPTYAIPGNHEWRYSDDWPQFRELLRRSGVHVLEDDIALATVGDQQLAILGTSEDSRAREGCALPDGEARTQNAFARLADMGGYKVVLSHCPMSFFEHIQYPFDMQLSGHAHGGQFRIPLIGRGLYSPDQGLFPKYAEGAHELDGHCLVISRGLGNSNFPQRLFNRPEIVLIKLTPAH